MRERQEEVNGFIQGERFMRILQDLKKPQDALKRIEDLRRQEINDLTQKEREMKLTIEAKKKDLNKQKKWLLDSVEKRGQEVKQESTATAELIWNVIKYPVKELPVWEFSNCAEPHAITGFSRADKLFGIEMKQDIKYLGTYKTTGLEEFPGCLHCKVTTKYVKNVITEHWWNDRVDKLTKLVSGLSSKLDDHDSLKNIQHFPIPMTNSSLKAENSTSTRGKRSAFVEQSEVNTLPNSRTSGVKLTSISSQLSQENIIDVNKQVTNSATRMSSWINGLFGWVKSLAASTFSIIPALPSQYNRSLSKLG